MSVSRFAATDTSTGRITIITGADSARGATAAEDRVDLGGLGLVGGVLITFAV
jgi:hypothetical protein